MKFNTQIKVLGMKANKGTMDNGAAYDSTRVYVETPLDEARGNAKGFAVADYVYNLSNEFERFKALAFPFMANATFEQVTTGKMQKIQLVDLQAIAPVKGA